VKGKMAMHLEVWRTAVKVAAFGRHDEVRDELMAYNSVMTARATHMVTFADKCHSH
jgi:hypothetical protein